MSEKAHGIVRLLLSSSANAALYGTAHPQSQRLLAQLSDELRAVLGETGELSLMLIDNELIVNGRPQEFTLFLSRFAQMLKGRGVEHVKFLKGITRQEVEGFIVALAAPAGQQAEFASSDHLRFGYLELKLGTEPGEEGEEGAEPADRLADLSHKELERFAEIYRMVRRRQKLKINGVLDIVSRFVEAFREQGAPLLVLAALRDNDEYTFTHSTNVCILNLAQAMALGIKGQLLNDIGVSAMLHDIGKLFVPEEIITKPGRLSDEEFELMKQHPVKGARYLMETAGVPRLAAVAAYEHHARLDLSGYPKLPPGWRLNLCSHLTMISDFFDATRTRRSYRNPLPLDQVTGMMAGLAGTELHPVLTGNFLRLLGDLKQPA